MKLTQSKSMFLPTLMLLLIAFLVGCSVKKPEAPSWETTWDLPLTSKNHTIQDLIDEMEDSLITFDSLGNPGFTITQEFDTVSVDDNLSAPGANHTHSDSLGVVDIDPPVINPASFSFADLDIPESAGQVPVDTFFTEDDTLDAFTSFTSVDVYQGNLLIEIVNELGIDIDSIAVVIIAICDTCTPNVIDTVIFEDGILDGSTSSRQINLTGKQLTNQITLNLYGAVKSQTINQPTGDLTIDCSFPSGISVSSAVAEIPGFTKDITQQIQLNDESIIYEAVIDNGTMTLQIINQTNLTMIIDISSSNFEHDGNAYSFADTITPQSTLNRSDDLSGYVFRPDGSTTPQSISINATAEILGTAPDHVEINCSDLIQITADVSDVVFSSVSGRLQPTEIDIEPMQKEVDIPDGLGDAQLTQAELRMRLYNNSTTDIYVDLLLSDETDTRNITISDTIWGKSNPTEEARETELTVGSLTLSSFLSPPPSEISITGLAIINPSYKDSISISKNDFFYGEVEIYSPLAFALNDTIELDLEITENEIESEDMPDFDETFIYGKIEAILTNHLPLGTQVSLFIGTNSSTIFEDSMVVIGPFVLQSALTDDEGYVTDAVISVISDSLSSDEIQIFENDVIYIAPKVALMPTGDNGVIITGSDYVGITATARLKVKAGEHLWENDDN